MKRMKVWLCLLTVLFLTPIAARSQCQFARPASSNIWVTCCDESFYTWAANTTLISDSTYWWIETTTQQWRCDLQGGVAGCPVEYEWPYHYIVWYCAEGSYAALNLNSDLVNLLPSKLVKEFPCAPKGIEHKNSLTPTWRLWSI